jgi:flagella basal body P-ring formation protein FlgA
MIRFFVFLVILVASMSLINCQALTFDELENVVTTEVQKAQKYPNIKVQISSHNDLTGNNNIVLEGVDFNEKDKFIVNVLLGDKQYKLHGSYYKYLSAPAAKHRISKGKVIDEDDIIMNDFAIDLFKSTTIIEPNKIIGMVSKINIDQNSLFKTNDLKPLIIVAKGDLVTLEFTRNNLEIKTTGVALDSGGLDDLIKVRVQDTKKVIVGKILSSSLVQVKKND